jgi:four helix bundle protein
MKDLQRSKFKDQSSNLRKFDLAERMEQFGTDIVQFCQKLEVNHVTRPMVSQLVRSATSIGANYSEANNSSSKKDFRNKVIIAKKESQETEYWLRMITPCHPEHKLQIQSFNSEAHELILILQSIAYKVRGEK